MSATIVGAEWQRRGVTREVLLVGRWAFKVPKLTCGWRMFLSGLLANMQEREFSTLGNPKLCPVVWSMPGGWLVVMRRAVPLSLQEWTRLDGDAFLIDPHPIPGENKPDSFGWLDGRIVVIDYGN